MVPPPALAGFLPGNILRRASPILANPRQAWLLGSPGLLRYRLGHDMLLYPSLINALWNVLPIFSQARLLVLLHKGSFAMFKVLLHRSVWDS